MQPGELEHQLPAFISGPNSNVTTSAPAAPAVTIMIEMADPSGWLAAK
jgi:hypothetical protein